jgi:hypothetical protein
MLSAGCSGNVKTRIRKRRGEGTRRCSVTETQRLTRRLWIGLGRKFAIVEEGIVAGGAG